MKAALHIAVADTGDTGMTDESDTESQPKSPPANAEQVKTARTRWRKRGSEDSPSEDDGLASTRRRIKTALRVIAAVMFLAVLTAAAYEGWILLQQRHKHATATQALDAAQNYAVTLTSTDPNAIDKNFTDILDGATGEFKDTYTKAGSQLRKMLIDNKVATKGEVVDSAIKSATTNKIEALLVVKQTITNSTSPEPRIDLAPVTITMEKVDGRWLASKVLLLSERG
ncbi:Mce protein [Mycobacterium sp. pUA109]|uniref:Mce protein n=1 Tax=Mycobacterium sp. pUA109 TaxID=3238982 RepID=UPI00351BAC64